MPAAAAERDPRLEEAKRLFREGNELRRAGDCKAALERYLGSRAILPSVPNTLNAGICLARLDRPDEALELYDELLTRFAPELTTDDRQAVAVEVSQLRWKVATLEVWCPVPAQLVVDGQRRRELPLTAPVRLLPGRHQVLVTRQGYRSFRSTFALGPGQSASIEASIEPAPGTQPGTGPAAGPTTGPRPPDRPRPRRAPSGPRMSLPRQLAWAGLGLGLAAGAAGAAFYGIAAARNAEFVAGRDDPAHDVAALDADRDQGRRYEAAAWVFLGTGAASLGTAAALFLGFEAESPRHERSPRPVAVLPLAAGGVLGLTLQGHLD
ncbi:MAG: hypothetical protein HY744_25560 [Deltaproteobacteria bacterium]|nr:hypothetical protein [Deltaproteobacteria bacterium]